MESLGISRKTEIEERAYYKLSVLDDAIYNQEVNRTLTED